MEDVFPSSCTSTIDRKEALHTTTRPLIQTEGRWGAYSVSKLGRLGEPAAVRHRPEQSLFTGTPVFNPRSSDRSSGGGLAPAPPPHPTSQTHVSSSSHHVQDVGVSVCWLFIAAVGLKLGLYSPGLGRRNMM